MTLIYYLVNIIIIVDVVVVVITGGQTVDVGPLAVAEYLELRQFHFRENGNGLGPAHPFVPDLTGRETNCNMQICCNFSQMLLIFIYFYIICIFI